MDVDRDIEKIRADFPLLRYVTFLDAANICTPNRRWLKAIMEFWRLRMAGRDDIANHPFLSEKAMHAKKEAAKLINAKEEEICYIYRVVTALNLVKTLIDWRKGDKVVFTDLAYPSSSHTWFNLRRFGVEMRRVENVDGMIRLEDLERAIDDQTRIVCINHTAWTTGFTYDVKAVCEIAHERGALVVDDAFQALGAVVCDVKRSGVDIMVSGSYKWQCGPEGAGVFYIRENLIEEFEPFYACYLDIEAPHGIRFWEPDHDNVRDYDYPPVKTAQRFDMGVCTGDILWGWDETLRYLNRLGPMSIERRVKRLGGYCIERLKEIGCKVNTPEEPEMRHGLITYTTGRYSLDKKSYEAMCNAMPRPIVASLRYQGGIGGIRLSIHFFNTEEDIDHALEVQRQVLKEHR
jgi:selenocysteine lyase/cysteine desulfurase